MGEKQKILPEGWKNATFAEVAKFITDFQANGSFAGLKENVKYYESENYAVLVRLKDLRKNLLHESDFIYTDKKGYDFLKKSGLNEGDILVANVGAGVGTTLLMPKLSKLATLAPNMFRVDLEDFVDKKLFYYFTKSSIYWQQLYLVSAGSGQPKINKSQYKSLSIPLPSSLYAQQVIVLKLEELFSELDNGIAQLKTAQQQLNTYRQSVLKWAFEGRLTNKHVKDGELPEGWKISTLKDITTEKDGLRRGPFGSAIKKSFFVPAGYKVYEQGNAINDDPYRGSYFIDEEKYQELINFKVLPGDLIVSCSGVTLGRICEIPLDAAPGVINQALLRIRLKKGIVISKYFIQYFRAAFFQKKIFAQSQGTAMPNLVGIKDFKEIELYIPTIEIQKEIVAEIERRLSVADKLQETIEIALAQSESLRQSILKQAFEGKLVKN